MCDEADRVSGPINGPVFNTKVHILYMLYILMDDNGDSVNVEFR